MREVKTITSDGCNRLVWAILDQTIRDWDKNAKMLCSSSMQIIAMYELKQIINFIVSDWYIYLTGGNSPQETIILGLLNRIKEENCREQLLIYARAKFYKPSLFLTRESMNRIANRRSKQ